MHLIRGHGLGFFRVIILSSVFLIAVVRCANLYGSFVMCDIADWVGIIGRNTRGIMKKHKAGIKSTMRLC